MQDDAAAVQAIVAQWMRWAQSDLALANMTQDERILPEILAFHAQQAVEKRSKLF